MQQPTMQDIKKLISNAGTENKKNDLPHISERIIRKNQSTELPLLDYVQENFMEAYGNLWPHTEIPELWQTGLSNLTNKQIRRAIGACMGSGDKFPPTLPQFMAFARQGSYDFDKSFMTYIRSNGSPQARIDWQRNADKYERAAAHFIGHKCRTEYNEAQAKAAWKREIIRLIEDDDKGQFPNIGQGKLTGAKTSSKWTAPNGKQYDFPAQYYAELKKGKN